MQRGSNHNGKVSNKVHGKWEVQTPLSLSLPRLLTKLINLYFYQREKDLPSEKLLEKDRNYAQELLKLKSKISSLEKDLVNQQVNFVNMEQEISETWKKSIGNLRLEMAELSNNNWPQTRQDILPRKAICYSRGHY